MPRIPEVLWIAASAALAVDWACAIASYLFGAVSAQSSSGAAVPQSSDNSVIYLDQGWSRADRDTWYWIPQGSVMMSYDIFQNLELADSQEPFRSDANMAYQGVYL